MTTMGNDLPSEFDPSTSILFLGSGFSRHATSISGKSPPVGRGASSLAGELRNLLKLPTDDDTELSDLAHLAQKKQIDIFELLESLFVIKNLSADQTQVLKKNWLRIYTTNYDDAVEHFVKDDAASPRRASYSIEDALPDRLQAGSVVHLHGYMHRCDRANVLKQLVLSHRSYVEQLVQKSEWWDQFRRDLRSASNVFFIGYSLQDFTVASYLNPPHVFKSKTHFIVLPDSTGITQSRVEDFGNFQDFGLAGFSDICANLKVGPISKDLFLLKAFKYFDPHKDSRTAVKPTPTEVEQLLTRGTFKIDRMLSTFPAAEYIMPRSSEVESALKKLGVSRSLIIHSKIGNGKSTFAQALAMKLSALDYKCFFFRDNVTIPTHEIDLLREIGRVAIFFTSYDAAYVGLNQLTSLDDKARFVVEVNRGTLLVRNTEVHGVLPIPVDRLDLDKLTKTDIEDLTSILVKSGLSKSQLVEAYRPGSELREILLELYSNKAVRHKLKNLLEPMLQDPEFRRVLCCLFLLKALNVEIEASLVKDVTGVDGLVAASKFGEHSHEIVSFDLDNVQPHSAILSEFLIANELDAVEICDWIFKLCCEAARRAHNTSVLNSQRARNARHAVSSLLRHQRLNDFFKLREDKTKIITDMYERCRYDSRISQEPLFWLQYSIFMQDEHEWSLAESLMATAYLKAADRPGFQTYQLDTNSFGLTLEIETNHAPDNIVTRIQSIHDKLEKIRVMLGDGNHRGHVLKVLSKIEPFIIKRGMNLDRSDAVRLVYSMNLAIRTLESYTPEMRSAVGSDIAMRSLQRAVQVLAR